jgi:peptidoglycan/xylan/chitin deacetylase (PgdA/CDA1 family)
MDLFRRAPYREPSILKLLLTLALASATVGALVSCAGTPPTQSPPASLVAPTASAAASLGPTATPTAAATPTPGATAAPSPTAGTATPAPTVTAATTPKPTPTARPTVRPTPRATPTAGPTTEPTPRPTPRPTPTPSPTSPAGPSLLIRHGSRTTNDVALTFDMGGRVGDAIAIMSWLIEHDVHASVFMTGAMADNPNTEAGRRVLAMIDAHPALFTLGNHSYTHRDFRNLSAAQIVEELRRTEAAVAPFCDQNLRPFFRPPNGGYDAAALAAIGGAGYRYTMTWDVDTIDWRPIVNDPPGPTADQMVAKVLANARGGSIVLMHLGGYETFEALPRIVAGLRAAGFDLVTLDELL